jgi:hypothetical protein
MEGYEVLTFDDQKAGTVVGREGQFLIVEHGSIFKHRRPVPETFATTDEDAHVVRLTVSKAILESAPEVHDGEFDTHAAAAHYGLADGEAAPETLGYGRLAPGDPATSAETELLATGELSTPAERATLHGHLGPGQGRNDRGLASPGMTGGDRRRDFERSSRDEPG